MPGKGCRTQFFEWLFDDEYPEAKRFRLEVTKSNEGAVRLYEKLGFTFRELPEDQMIKSQITQKDRQPSMISPGTRIF